MSNHIPLLLLTVPVIGSIIIFFLKESKIRHAITFFSAVHLLLALSGVYYRNGVLTLGSIQFGFDIYDPAFYVLVIASLLFFFITLYLRSWIPADAECARIRKESHAMSNRVFSMLMLLFLETMTITALSRDFGTLWVAVEATTLASAPLIHFHKTKSSLEAMWKYLLLCSLGIGLALFGTMLLSASLDAESTLSFGNIAVKNPVWFKAAFVFCFAGYGLKCGLAPFHSWLPDAHSEAPAPVSALLSGSLLNCALLGIWRMRDIAPEGTLEFCNNFFIFFGFASLVLAALFIIGQKDYKRMLAYSSVEHMGLIALLIGFTAEGTALLHMICHSFMKMMLFLAAGNIFLCFGTRRISAVQGIFTTLPRASKVWMAGVLLICGLPPSPLFFTEWVLVSHAGALYGSLILLLLFIIFCAMSNIAMKMCMGYDSNSEGVIQLDAIARKVNRVPAFLLYAVITGTIFTAGLIYLIITEKISLF